MHPGSFKLRLASFPCWWNSGGAHCFRLMWPWFLVIPKRKTSVSMLRAKFFWPPFSRAGLLLVFCEC